MPTSPRRWLLPDRLRSAVVVVDTACAGLAVLLRVRHDDDTELLTWLGAIAAVATLLALVPRKRRPPTARTVAAVIAASQAPIGRIFARCAMVLRLNDTDGSPKQFVYVDPYTPVAMWPVEGSRVVVEVTQARRPKVAVLWPMGVGYPEPPDGSVDESGVLIVPGLAEADMVALPRLERVGSAQEWTPSHVARWYLVPTEKFRGEWRRHWIRWFKEAAVGLGIALLILSGYRAQMRGFVVDLTALPSPDLLSKGFWGAWVLWRGLTWMNTRLVLTNKRVMLIKGLLWRRVASVPLAKAADILHTKSLLGVLLNYGTFRFSGVRAFRPLWRVTDLPRPRELYLQIVAETFEPEPEPRHLSAQLDDSLDDMLAAPSPR